MDETTFPFSKKVLDRANTIVFNEVELVFEFDNEVLERLLELYKHFNNIADKYNEFITDAELKAMEGKSQVKYFELSAYL